MQRINADLYRKGQPPYILNLDPAVRKIPYEPNIDIRDSVNYKKVMSEYNLGPNGGILTSLNLFSTKVDQVIDLLEKRCTPKSQTTPLSAPASTAVVASSSNSNISHILVDTPGQIEVFVWSASGEILLSSLASSFPTVIAYIIDTPRTASTSTFMSNMLYACSILYRTKLPMILVFNKTDVKDAQFAKEWMTDFEAFQDALRSEEEAAESTSNPGSGYMNSLLNSMSLVLEEFYRHLDVVGVSSMTGAGVDEFFEAVQKKGGEFMRDYKPELERRRLQKQKEAETRKEKELTRLMEDINVSNSGSGGPTRGKLEKEEPETVSEAEDEAYSDDREGEESDDETGRGAAERDDDLIKRYRAAMGEDFGPTGEDMSFARYVRSGNTGV